MAVTKFLIKKCVYIIRFDVCLFACLFLCFFVCVCVCVFAYNGSLLTILGDIS